MKKLIQWLTKDKDAKCPKCGRTNSDMENNIWHCYECGHEWGA